MVARKEVAISPTPEPRQLALASVGIPGAVGNYPGNFYMPNGVDQINQRLGVFPDKLIIPREYHAVIDMCYDFYQRGGIVGTVVNRLTELAMTTIVNGQRRTTDEGNAYFQAILHRRPSRLNRYIHTMALEYFLSGMILPRIEWEEIPGNELSPDLVPSKTYMVPVADMYPPKLTLVTWIGWGKKEFRLKIPDRDIRMIKNQGGKIKEQQYKYLLWKEQYPSMIQAVNKGENSIKLDSDAILRKEVSFTEYPTPFLFNILEALTFKQQLRRMDYATASRIINAILLVTEGDKDFPITEETRGNLDALKQQIAAYTNSASGTQRLFALFSNHTTKLSWIAPDVQAMLDQSKYQQVNEEIGEGLGLAKILITGESRNAQASEVSTWAIQPMMEELREMILEWLSPVYEEAARKNGFRKTPIPIFTPIRLQDFIKTAAVFAAAFKEGNVSRTTRDQMMGLNFETELELMKDEKELMAELTSDGEDFPEMPYNVLTPPGMGGIGGGLGRPAGSPNKGGRPTGTQNKPINKRNRGVSPKGEPTSKLAETDFESELGLLPEEEFIELVNKVMEERGIYLTAEAV
jgi:hypothetical protein